MFFHMDALRFKQDVGSSDPVRTSASVAPLASLYISIQLNILIFRSLFI